MKNNKGISLVSLVVMIILMILLASYGVNVGINNYNKSLETKAAEENQQVKLAVSNRFGDNQRNNTSYPLVGLVIPEDNANTIDMAKTYIIYKLRKDYNKLNNENYAEDEANIQKFVNDNFSEMEYTRILTSTDLVELGIENTNLNSIFIVNYYSSDVVGPIN